MNVGWSKDNAVAGMLCPSKIHMLNLKAPCNSCKRWHLCEVTSL